MSLLVELLRTEVWTAQEAAPARAVYPTRLRKVSARDAIAAAQRDCGVPQLTGYELVTPVCGGRRERGVNGRRWRAAEDAYTHGREPCNERDCGGCGSGLERAKAHDPATRQHNRKVGLLERRRAEESRDTFEVVAKDAASSTNSQMRVEPGLLELVETLVQPGGELLSSALAHQR
jgi:hypothetical protein